MSLLSILSWFGLGLVLILVSAESLIFVAKELAYKWKLSPLFVALAVVALGTNLPEFTVLISAILKGDPGLAIGNIVGSNISNLALVFGLAIIMSKPRIGTVKTPRNAQLMLLITVLFMLLRWSSFSPLFQGAVLLSAAGLIFISQYVMAVRGRNHEDKKLFRVFSKFKRKRAKLSSFSQSLILFLSLVALIAGGRLVVESSQAIAAYFHVTTTVIGLTLVAVSTSLPELLTVVVAGMKGEDKISVGTIVGSNIYNLGLFAGILLFLLPGSVLSTTDTAFLLLTTLFGAGIILFNRGRRIDRWVGLVLASLFVLFVFQTVIF